MQLDGLLSLFDASLRPVRDRLAAGGACVFGIPDGAKAGVIAALASAQPVLLLVTKRDRAEAFCDEVAVWSGAPEGVLLFPESDALPYERGTRDGEAARQRLSALQVLHTPRGEAHPILIAPALALAQRTVAPESLQRSELMVRVGMRLSLETLMRQVERMGYAVEPLAELPGQAARRGGIVDIYPPDAPLPFRIEFFGDEVESVRRFHPATQRTTERVDAVRIGPTREDGGDPVQVRTLRAGLDFRGVDLGLRPRLEEELDRIEQGEARDEALFSPLLLTATLLDHLPPNTLVITDEAREVSLLLEELDRQAADTCTQLERAGKIPRGLPLSHVPRAALLTALAQRAPRLDLQRWATSDGPPPAEITEQSGLPPVVVPPFRTAEAFGGRLRTVFADVTTRTRADQRVVITSQQSARLSELFHGEGLAAAPTDRVPSAPPPGTVALLHGSLAHGWTLDLPDGPLTLLTDTELFGFTKQRRTTKSRGSGREAFLIALTPGDLVVHVEHGIARFAGLVRRAAVAPDGSPVEREYLELRYAERDRLFVPTEQVDRVDRYVGPSDHAPHLTRLGSGEWGRTKERVRRVITDLAQDLLRLYAQRELRPGFPFPEDTPWQQEMEAAFPYVETPDQLTALHDIKQDMEADRPMDRVVVGDVGYGKTEVAIRAAFKAVVSGKQVAVLVPTTVLAQQHLQTFTERISGFPMRVDVLSRFRSEAEAQQVLTDVAAGAVDILVGTHRILGKDVRFNDLGLVIIDEEQRFGVSHKERLKQLRAEVDVLTLSATPIPRTLHMALSGIRDMSTMETAPEDRLPVKTFVSEWDDRLIRDAILRELDRGGQVYVVHNRVNNIELLGRRLRDLVPEVEIAIGHGQMPEEQLERTMLAFGRGECDVLLCTTIIESGLDIPNVNTIIINQANRLGLSQLYQLRGRVGRGAHRAFAYLLYDKDTALTETAQKRLQAIFEATELGAGFQIAMKDLEIRGAGNLLGAEQSGHIGAVGYELYSRMLAEAVARMRALQQGEPPPPAPPPPAPPPPAPPPPITVDLPITAHVPETFIPDINLRLTVYQRLGQVSTLQQVEDAAAEIVDRFGEPPPSLRSLLDVVRIKALAREAGLTSVTIEDGQIVLRAPRPIERRERLIGAFGDAVQVGSTQVRVAQRGDWRNLLMQVLAVLNPQAGASSAPNHAPPASANHGGRGEQIAQTRQPTDPGDGGTRAVQPTRRERPPQRTERRARSRRWPRG